MQAAAVGRPPVLAAALARGLPAAVLAAVVAAQASGALDAETGAERVHALLRTIVWSLFLAMVLIRGRPVRRSRSAVGIGAALVVIAPAVAIGQLPVVEDGGGRLLAADVVMVVGSLFSVASVLVLGRCFGVLPDARGLVVRGPYRLVRHPLYLGELVTIAGMALASRDVALAVALLALLVALQLVRARAEEETLRAAFPEYDAYAERTPRLIPRLR